MKLASPVSMTLAMLVTLVASAAAVWALKWRPPAPVSVSLPLAAGVMDGGGPRVHLRPAALRHVRPAGLRAEVLVADSVHDAERGRIALPAGTRLRLRLTAAQEGRLEVAAVNDIGQRTSLWQTDSRAGSEVRTPGLVLQGRRGLETLQVLLRGSDGEVLAQRDVEIWHQ